jgi:hypothetical protein
MSAYSAAGYEALIERYQLDVIPNWHSSFVAVETQVHKIEKDVNTVREHYPERYWPVDRLIYSSISYFKTEANFQKQRERNILIS